jgi:hypothetical protein
MSRSQKKSKSRVRIYTKKGGLPGYTLKKSLKNRRSVLVKIAKKQTPGKVVKKLNVLYIYNKNNHPETAQKFRKDMKFIQKKFKSKSRTKRRRSKSRTKRRSRKSRTKRRSRKSRTKRRRSKSHTKRRRSKSRTKRRSRKSRTKRRDGNDLPQMIEGKGYIITQTGPRHLDAWTYHGNFDIRISEDLYKFKDVVSHHYTQNTPTGLDAFIGNKIFNINDYGFRRMAVYNRNLGYAIPISFNPQEY